jgi:MFS family permease
VLASRRMAEVTLAPAAGFVADRLGFRAIVPSLMVTLGSGLTLVAFGHPLLGGVVAALGYGAAAPLWAGLALEDPRMDRLTTLASLTTWVDLGATLGPLLGGLAIIRWGNQATYIGASMILIPTLGGLLRPMRS